MATRCLGGRFTLMRITLDVKYVPISIDNSSDSTCAGIENLARNKGTVGGEVGVRTWV